MSSIKNATKEKLIDLITLGLIPGIGNKRLIQLNEKFGSLENITNKSREELIGLNGFSTNLIDNILSNIDRDKALRIVESIEEKGWEYVIYDEPAYPEPLKNTDDKPAFLFYFGDYKKQDQNAVAIVGSRMASESGLIFTRELAMELARNNITVVSGMARGVDTSAHRGALEAGGRTLAIFGSSLDNIYPPENRDLAKEISESGAIISEFLPGTIPDGHNFPRRNRIISGLSLGVIVVEAAEKSGALSTVTHALSQNREVFAVPGSPRNKHSKGTNRLIKEGATLVTSIDDVFENLPRLKSRAKTARVKNTLDLTKTEKVVLEKFSDGPVHIDILSRDLDSPISDILQILLALELKGIIKELSGKRYILA